MTDAAERIYRPAAIARLSSPEQLDHLVRITRPFDWAAGGVIFVGIAVLVIWSVVGRVATRVSGEGILIGNLGGLVDATSTTAGRLASVGVAIGDRVARGQIVARIAQTEAEQRYHSALEVLRQREREHAELSSAVEREMVAKTANFIAQRAALNQASAVAEQRAAHLTSAIAKLEESAEQSFATQRSAEDTRRDLADAQQRIADARREMLRLEAQQIDLETQRERERLSLQLRVDEARRQADELAGALAQGSVVTSPIDGRVVDIKMAEGAAVAVGSPVIEIDSERNGLAALIYVPAERGKNVRPGMEARIEPMSVKREEFGAAIGSVVSVSEYPATPQGMAAMLRNETLVARFSREGASYAVTVELQRDERTVSGYRWSSGKGPPSRLTTGTLARAEITTSERPPIDLVVPLLKRSSGNGG